MLYRIKFLLTMQTNKCNLFLIRLPSGKVQRPVLPLFQRLQVLVLCLWMRIHPIAFLVLRTLLIVPFYALFLFSKYWFIAPCVDPQVLNSSLRATTVDSFESNATLAIGDTSVLNTPDFFPSLM